MMGNLSAGRSARTHLDGLHPARLSQIQIDSWLPPLVLADSRHRVRIRLDDHVGWTAEYFLELPGVVIGPLFGRRHILGVALRSAGIHPAGDRFYLLIAQRSVILEVLHADRLVQMPWRHLVRYDAFLDG